MDIKPFFLALVRIVIGWHFLYEGWTKLIYPGWTSAGYLKSSTGPLGPFFHWLASSDTAVRGIDLINIWGLLLAGAALMLGLFVRPAAVFGMSLLALYYLAYPPFFSPLTAGSNEGSYLIVNKNLVELFALLAVAAFPASAFGLDGLRARSKAGGPPRETETSVAALASRRQLLSNLAGAPFLGGFVLAVLKKHGWRSFEEVRLAPQTRRNGAFIASATVKSVHFAGRSDLKGSLPYGQIRNLRLSRMILGGNLMGGWAHARDLIYVSKLVKAYHHRDKVFQTFALAESCGVNTILTNPLLCDVINDYWRNGGRIQFISDCGGKDILAMIRQSIDRGAAACYIQGGVADKLVEESKFDLMAQALDLIRSSGLPAGIGGHKLATVKACVEKGLRPDFWMKTLHHVDYWSAKPQPECDNIWCDSPAETVEFMRHQKEPWIAFKVLAAGAIEPQAGFRYAFESGADFICVGMYDFQIVDDVNIAVDVLRRLVRRREWYA